ncbi:MAG: ABC transporter permease [Clostridia bacterium]
MNKNIKDFFTLTKRHTKLYFKEKGAFLPSLITPVILVVLFITFLKNVYSSVLLTMIPEGIVLDGSVVNAFTGCWLISSILGVSCVTIAFCSNIIMASDKFNKTINDFYVAPIKKNVISLSYLFSNFFSTMIICLSCMILAFVYFAFVGWFFSFVDVLAIISVVILSCLFGSTLANVFEYYISTIGGISAISTLVSSMYGFICGAYMPLAQFSLAIRNLISCLPGTYCVGLIRNLFMGGVLREMSNQLPTEVIETIKINFDGNLFFFGSQVEVWQMFLVVAISTLVFLTINLCFVFIKKKKKAII